jgi:hypothetical protein
MADDTEERKRFIRIGLEPPFTMSGPMGTAIISRVPSFRIQRDDWEASVLCSISRLARQLASCGMSEERVRDAVARAEALEYAGETIEVEFD